MSKEKDSLYSILIKISIALIVLFTSWLVWDHISNKSLELYEKALMLDADLEKGMHWLDRLLYNVQEVPPSIKDRLIYLKEQFLLNEDQRLLSVPEIDKDQPNYER